MTDSAPDAEAPNPPRRGLWAVMGQTASPVMPGESAPGDSHVAPISALLPNEPESASTSEPPTNVVASGRRGLWDLMKKTTVEPSVEVAAEEVIESDPITEHEMAESELAKAPTRPASPRGLFSLMQRGTTDEVESRVTSDTGGLTEENNPTAVPHSIESPVSLTLCPDDGREGARREEKDEEEEESYSDQEFAAPFPSVPIDPDDLEPPRYRRAAAQAAKQSWFGLACGVAALAASALTMLPQVWSGIPATTFGFAGILVGYSTLTGAARRELALRSRVVSFAAMGLGALGIFLGPLFFSGLGRALREATGQQVTARHLDQIGFGLKRHHDLHSAYPAGGVFVREANGVTKGRHGWMTFLLPFIGEEPLFQSIDRGKSYDDPVNRVAMGRDVEAFFAAGGDRARIGQGFAVSHFAGVGGEIDDAGGLAHVGIFQRDEAVKIEEVTDGLANTLIVGELAGTYPPWGDPENWRTIGRGLNKDVNGFGSATGHGATFLLGDGSVRFFNNQTDPKLLRKLSTRDGAE